jgi:hypothetical protein
MNVHKATSGTLPLILALAAALSGCQTSNSSCNSDPCGGDERISTNVRVPISQPDHWVPRRSFQGPPSA